MAIPFPNCLVDIWEDITLGPGVPPNHNAIPAAMQRPFYPINIPQTPIVGFPLIYRLLLHPIIFNGPVRATGSGVYVRNLYFRYSVTNNPFIFNQVFQIMAISPHMSLAGVQFWYCYAYYWGPQP
jgi:hypothetical protein